MVFGCDVCPNAVCKTGIYSKRGQVDPRQLKGMREMSEEKDIISADFDLDIAELTLKIKGKSSTDEKPSTDAKPSPNDYINRALARCLNNVSFDKAIEDCSIALQLLKDEHSDKKSRAYAIRAFAYYLIEDRIRAHDDCGKFKEQSVKNPDDEQFVCQLQARLYSSTRKA
jgi:hypothetical protein